jgi:hypothetical protein
MKGVIAHGALLAAALVAALVIWTSPVRTEPTDATVPVWQFAANDVASVTFRDGDRTLLVEWRQGDGPRYLWARDAGYEIDPLGRDAPSSADHTAAEDGEAAIEEDTSWRVEKVEEFPVGREGEELFEQLARLNAIRDLGEATADKHTAFGMGETAATIALRLRNGNERVLALGNSVVGGGDRYALDVERNRFYVLPASLIRPLENSGMLRLHEHQSFTADQVASVTVRARGAERTALRRMSGSPPRANWTPTGSDHADAGFAGFMEQVDRLWISRYAAEVDPATLEPLARVDYQDRRGNGIGFLELSRRPGDDENPTIYYMRTGRTIVPGEIYTPLAERLEQELESLVRGGGVGVSDEA